MHFKAGDKVIFLNEKGGGIVTRVIDEQVVHVAIEDGFEIPYAVTDIIKAERETPGERPLTAPFRQGAAPSGKETDLLHRRPHQTEEYEKGVYLAMVPRNQEKPLTSTMDFFLVNHSPYRLLFALYLNKSGTYRGLASGTAEAGTKYHLSKVERNEIEDWAHALLQGVFYSDGKAEVLPVGEGEIKFKLVKIYKEDSFPFNPLINQKAMMVEVIRPDKRKKNEGQPIGVPDAIKQLKEGEAESRIAPRPKHPPKNMLDKHMVGENTAEVDLHIGELTESTLNMTNADILMMQLNYVRDCLKQARLLKVKKLILIHGVGNGKLKQELQQLLNKETGVDFHDAPYARYGMGATEVVFFQPKKSLQ